MQVGRASSPMSLHATPPLEGIVPLAQPLPQVAAANDFCALPRRDSLGDKLHDAFQCDDETGLEILEDLASRTEPTKDSRVHQALMTKYWAPGSAMSEAVLRKSVALARAMEDKKAEFYALCDLFSYQLAHKPMADYWPWMQLARLYRPYDKESLQAAIRLIPEVMPGSAAPVAERAIKLLLCPVGRKLRRFARSEIVPVAQWCLDDPHEKAGFCYGGQPLRTLIWLCN